MLDVQGAGVQAEEHDGDHQDAKHGERGAQRGERLPPRPHQLRYPEQAPETSEFSRDCSLLCKVSKIRLR